MQLTNAHATTASGKPGERLGVRRPGLTRSRSCARSFPRLACQQCRMLLGRQWGRGSSLGHAATRCRHLFCGCAFGLLLLCCRPSSSSTLPCRAGPAATSSPGRAKLVPIASTARRGSIGTYLHRSCARPYARRPLPLPP
jgi:hypothetical protein